MQFIEKYGRTYGEEEDEEMLAEENEVRNFSDEEFIDDEESFQNQCPSDYRLVTVTRDMTEACNDLEDWKEFECSGPENYVHEAYGTKFLPEEIEYDEFKGFEKRIKKIQESLKQYKNNEIESFYCAILYDTYFKLKGLEQIFLMTGKGSLERCFLNSSRKKGQNFSWILTYIRWRDSVI